MHRQSPRCRNCYRIYAQTDEYRKKLSQKRVGKPSYIRTAAHRAKMSKIIKERKPYHPRWTHTPETIEKMRALWTPEKRAAKRLFMKRLYDNKVWRLNRHKYVLRGDKHPRWKGGMSQTPYAPGFNKALKARIRQRDKYKCQLCGITEEDLPYPLSIHHSDYDKSNHDESNLFATCRSCNSRVNTNREVWYEYFDALAYMRDQLGKNIDKLIGRKIISQREGFIFTNHI